MDLSDPALLPGMTAEKVHAGIAVAQRQYAEHAGQLLRKLDLTGFPIRQDQSKEVTD
jgi:hypothetical protein